jgi:hypothetical protein
MDWYIILILGYMMLGLFLFEWSWAQVKSIREVNESRDSKYPAYRRLDAIKWRKWKFYFGAVTWMPLRVLFGFGSVVLLFLFNK